MDKSKGGATKENPSSSSQATESLQLLLREDPHLEQLKSGALDPYQYASSLFDVSSKHSHQRLATAALLDVERKLTLVESLSVKLSRTSPEELSRPFLELHSLKDSSSTASSTLSNIRESTVRLERQAESLESAAQRVETVLAKGYGQLETTTQQLQRTLVISSTLKRILKLQFESQKLLNYDLDDVRDLTRAAASVAILEELLDRPELQEAPIAVVERLRPVCTQIARDVRRAAQTRLAQPNNISQLGAVLQVYFSLKELPRAVWEYVDQQCAAATAKTKEIWNAQSLNALNEQVKKQQKDSRSVQKKFKQVRGDLCRDWAEHILELCQHVRSLEKVLNHKTDPVSRTVFIKVVSESPVPPEYQQSSKADKGFSIFDLFWGRFSNSLSTILDDLLSQPTLSDDIAALYPAVRAASLDLLGHLISHSVQLSQYTNMEEGGILGGSSILQDPFLNSDIGSENPQAASAVRWTVPSDVPTNNGTGRRFSTRSSMLGAPSAFSTSVLQNSPEWKTLQGSATSRGLFLLEEAFMQACEERLIAPLQYLFPENVTLGEDGVTISSGLSLLPSKYDLQRFDENIRQELSLSDPREGGGDLTLVSMIAQCVVSMISEFCLRAKKAMSGVDSVSGYLHASDWSMTDNLQHDRKVAVIMYTMGQYLTNAPDKTFVAPYRPAVLPQQIEASELCSQALGPAVTTINNTVEAVVLVPLCRALNLKISSVLARIHSGVYLTSGDDDDQSPSFVQKELTRIFETIADKHLSKFPPTYASVITSSVMAHTIYTFITTVSMVRPMSEYARLHITQDLADLEMALEQFASRTGLTLNHVENGKPYAELRAVRQMLYWTGLENKTRSAEEIAKSLLREVWLKDVRPSTVFHYLFSFGPSLLSAPHHVQRCTATEYVNILVTTDRSTNGEDASWMTIVSSCDSYQQRASAGASTNDGDSRVAQIVLSVGQELLRRR